LAGRNPQNSGFSARRKAASAGLLIPRGAIGAFATLIKQRTMAAGLLLALTAAGLGGFRHFFYVESGGTTGHQINSAANARAEQTPARPLQAQGDRQNSVLAATPPSPPKENAPPSTPSKAAVAQPISTGRDPALASWFVASYLKCWAPPTNLPVGEKYGAQIRVVHRADGSLASPPRLVNPPMDPEWRAYADSAVRAVTKCNPLHVPPQYAAQFYQWRKMTLYF
jgi:hypothetical protein